MKWCGLGSRLWLLSGVHRDGGNFGRGYFRYRTDGVITPRTTRNRGPPEFHRVKRNREGKIPCQMPLVPLRTPVGIDIGDFPAIPGKQVRFCLFLRKIYNK